MASTNGTGELLAYPNPTMGVVHVTGSANEGMGAHAELLDRSGRIVLRSLITGPTLSLDLSAYEPGIYYLRLHGKTASRSLCVAKY
ncbi:MAG TPA: T9SS type A sorting domain-containing protein [Flavobacteriales bacterium]|nr:T9SS type A sorting domain-containing protein [Flavobacteriales bacterium]